MNCCTDFLPVPFGDIVREAFSIILKQASKWQPQLFHPLLPARMQNIQTAVLLNRKPAKQSHPGCTKAESFTNQ